MANDVNVDLDSDDEDDFQIWRFRWDVAIVDCPTLEQLSL